MPYHPHSPTNRSKHSFVCFSSKRCSSVLSSPSHRRLLSRMEMSDLLTRNLKTDKVFGRDHWRLGNVWSLPGLIRLPFFHMGGGGGGSLTPQHSGPLTSRSWSWCLSGESQISTAVDCEPTTLGPQATTISFGGSAQCPFWPILKGSSREACLQSPQSPRWA